MSASQKSWTGGTLLDDAQRLILNARTALNELPKWEKPFHIFWLLGPFFLLIERSPADAWLSILALSFAVRSLCQRNGAWLCMGGCAPLLFSGLSVCCRRLCHPRQPMRLVRPYLGLDFPYLPWPRFFGLGVINGLFMRCSFQPVSA